MGYDMKGKMGIGQPVKHARPMPVTMKGPAPASYSYSEQLRQMGAKGK